MITVKAIKRPLVALLPLAAIVTLASMSVSAAYAAPVPSRFFLTSHIGLRVDKDTGGNVCAVASKDECVEPPEEFFEPIETSLPGAFNFPHGVAVAPNGNVYVADSNSHRVQELDAAGNFVAMFGKEVNETTHLDVCTEEEIKNSGVKCQAGVDGGAPGQFSRLASIAVDPVSSDVYVIDTVFGEVVGGGEGFAQRVQVFSPAGQLLLEIGKNVNKTNNTNMCAAVECQAAALQTFAAAEANTEPGAFDLEVGRGNLLAFGGAKDVLYVGDHVRVQEFNSSTGAPEGQVSLAEISPTGMATGVAVDPAGDVFVTDSEAAGVHEYNPSGVLQALVIDRTSSGLQAIALDPHGRLGIIDLEGGTRGLLYNVSGARISEFAPPSGELPGNPTGLAFSPSDEAYVMNQGTQQLETYTPIVFPETRTCAPSEVTGTSTKLCGEINPDGVHASAFFQYGKTSALGSSTPFAFEGQSEAFEPFSSTLTSLVPNQEYHYRAAVEAEANGEKLQGHGEEQTFTTPVLAPVIPGNPTASFVVAQSAVLSAALNPEHTTTHYHFEYGACPTLTGCATTQSTPEEVSAVYGTIGTTAEIVGLAPSTTYAYRLVAINEFEETGQKHEQKVTGLEGTFTTPSASIPHGETGAYTALGATSTIISGLVEPHGVPTSYAFELGIYNSANTQYGTVASGSAGVSDTPVPVSLLLTGLQPGTTYAYRITISSGYLLNETHTQTATPVVFVTPGLPAVLAAPPILTQLPIPNIHFPRTVTPPRKHKKTPIRKRHRNSKKRPTGKKAQRHSNARQGG